MSGFRTKMKYLLGSRNYHCADYADHIGMSRQGFNQKLKREAFYLRDLIALGNFTNYKLAYVDQMGRPVVIFEKEDLDPSIKRKRRI